MTPGAQGSPYANRHPQPEEVVEDAGLKVETAGGTSEDTEVNPRGATG